MIAAAGPPTYRLDQVTKRYEARTVLQVDQLEVRPGETLAILGPSGAGKTTLLRLLALVDRPTNGCVFFCGQPTAGESTPIDQRRRIAMVFQRPALLTRSVRANVAYGLRLRARRAAQNRLNGILAELRLDELERRIATTLSGGEKQRVALARALALETDVLLLDEPTAHLDPGNVALVENRLREQARNGGHTVVLATHNMFQARRLADRVALLLEGRLIEDAPTAQFFDAPTDPRTGAFLRGEMVY
jgi:tungstate transport system ATP-binding protein